MMSDTPATVTPTGGMRPATLQRNAAWTVTGNVVYAAAQWGMLSVLAKNGGPDMVGQFTLGLAFTAPIMMLAGLDLRKVLATDAHGQFAFGHYLGLRISATALALALIIVVVMATTYDSTTKLVILLVALIKAIDAISDIYYGLWQQREYLSMMAKSMMANGLLTLLVLGLVVILTDNLPLALLGSAVISAVVLCWFNARVLLQMARSEAHRATTGSMEDRIDDFLKPRWDAGIQRTMFLLALPLGVVALLGSLNTNVPRFFIERFLGSRELGVYAALAYCMMAGRTIVTALGNAASPRLARLLAQREYGQYQALLVKLLGIGLMGSVAGIVLVLAIGDSLIALLYTEDFAAYTRVLLILTIATATEFAAAVLSFGMIASRKLRIQIWLELGSLAASVAMCAALVSNFGLNGIALAAVGSSVVKLIGSALVTRFYMREWDIALGS